MTTDSILNILIHSEKRKKILFYLLTGKKTIEEIKKICNTRSSSLMVQLKILQKKNIIFEKNNYYELTELGNILIPEM